MKAIEKQMAESLRDEIKSAIVDNLHGDQLGVSIAIYWIDGEWHRQAYSGTANIIVIDGERHHPFVTLPQGDWDGGGEYSEVDEDEKAGMIADDYIESCHDLDDIVAKYHAEHTPNYIIDRDYYGNQESREDQRRSLGWLVRWCHEEYGVYPEIAPRSEWGTLCNANNTTYQEIPAEWYQQSWGDMEANVDDAIGHLVERALPDRDELTRYIFRSAKTGALIVMEQDGEDEPYYVDDAKYDEEYVARHVEMYGPPSSGDRADITNEPGDELLVVEPV